MTRYPRIPQMLLALLMAATLALSFGLATPPTTHAGGMETTNRFPNDESSRKCQCGW
jgi:hypothetical protein